MVELCELHTSEFIRRITLALLLTPQEDGQEQIGCNLFSFAFIIYKKFRSLEINYSTQIPEMKTKNTADLKKPE